MKNENDIIKAWIKIQEMDDYESEEAKELFWAVRYIDRLCFSSPEKCLDLILKISNEAKDKWILTNLAAGPLEALLYFHPYETVRLIEIKKDNKNMRYMLSNIYTSSIPDEVIDKLKKI